MAPRRSFSFGVWKKSLRFVVKLQCRNGTDHTGLFERAAVGQGGAAAEIVSIRQTNLNVAVQWGIIGCRLVCHVVLDPHVVPWRGIWCVDRVAGRVQNICTSLFNSICSIFTRMDVRHRCWRRRRHILGQRPRS